MTCGGDNLLVPVDARLQVAPVEPNLNAWRAGRKSIGKSEHDLLAIDAGVTDKVEWLQHCPLRLLPMNALNG